MNLYKPSEITIYYAHPMSWYGTEREMLDLEYLHDHFKAVINPGTKEWEATYDKWLRDNPSYPAMQFWLKLVDKADAIAYRTFQDGKLGSGVAAEVFHARIHGKHINRLIGNDRWGTQVMSIPSDSMSIMTNLLTIEQTKERVRNGTL